MRRSRAVVRAYRVSAGIIVALREGIAVRHVSLKGDPSRPDGDLVAVPALAHLVELNSDKRPHELDCQSQSGVKIGAPSGFLRGLPKAPTCQTVLDWSPERRHSMPWKLGSR